MEVTSLKFGTHLHLCVLNMILQKRRSGFVGTALVMTERTATINS